MSRKIRLGDIASFQRGLTYSKGDEVASSSKIVLRSNNIDLDTHSLDLSELKYLREDFVIPDDRKVKKDTIFICMSNGSKQHVGKVAYIDRDMQYAFGGFMGLIVPDASVSAKYVYYACNSASYRTFLSQIGNGIGITNLRFSDLERFELPVPSIEKQRSIVDELDLLSNIIEDKNEQLRDLDAIAQSIFYEMFGDPIANDKGWKICSVGDLCTEVKYGTSRPSSPDGKYDYIRMNNLTYSGELDFTDLKKIDIPDEELGKCIVRKGDVLFNRTNSLDLIGKTALYTLDEPMVIAGYIIRVRLDDNRMNPNYFVQFMNLPSSKKMLRKMAKGAVNQANINSKELQSIKLPCPPLDKQLKYASICDSIRKQKAEIFLSVNDIGKLLSSRMDYYFND